MCRVGVVLFQATAVISRKLGCCTPPNKFSPLKEYTRAPVSRFHTCTFPAEFSELKRVEEYRLDFLTFFRTYHDLISCPPAFNGSLLRCRLTLAQSGPPNLPKAGWPHQHHPVQRSVDFYELESNEVLGFDTENCHSPELRECITFIRDQHEHSVSGVAARRKLLDFIGDRDFAFNLPLD